MSVNTLQLLHCGTRTIIVVPQLKTLHIPGLKLQSNFLLPSNVRLLQLDHKAYSSLPLESDSRHHSGEWNSVYDVVSSLQFCVGDQQQEVEQPRLLMHGLVKKSGLKIASSSTV